MHPPTTTSASAQRRRLPIRPASHTNGLPSSQAPPKRRRDLAAAMHKILALSLAPAFGPTFMPSCSRQSLFKATLATAMAKADQPRVVSDCGFASDLAPFARTKSGGEAV